MGFDPGQQAREAAQRAAEAAREAQEAARRNAENAQRSAEISRENAERGAEMSRRSAEMGRRGQESIGRRDAGSAPMHLGAQPVQPRYVERYDAEGGGNWMGGIVRVIVLIVVLAIAWYVLFGPDIHAWSSFCNINGNPICGTTTP